MANWTGVITNSGISLLAQWTAGSTLTITTAKAGTGTVAEAAMMAQTGLVTEKATMSIISGETVTGGRKIKLQLASQTTAFTLNQIGVWARVDSGTAALLALFQNSDGVPIPSSTTSPDFSYNFYGTLSISNTGTFSITVDPSAFVSESTMEEYAEALSNKVTEISASSTDAQYPTAKAVYDDVYTPLNTNKAATTYVDSHDGYLGNAIGMMGWNQLCPNGDFHDTSAWADGYGFNLTSVSNGIGTFTCMSTTATARAGFSVSYISGHKYIHSTDIYIPYTSVVKLWAGAWFQTTVEANTWTRVVAIGTSNVTATYSDNPLMIPAEGWTIGDTIQVKNFNTFDLTTLFGEGREPSTVEEFRKMFPADYYPHFEGFQGQLAPEYETTCTYNTGNYASHEKQLYKCSTDSVTGAWDHTKWTKVNVGAQLELLNTSLTSHTGNTSNPHAVTKSQVGLGNVGNFKAVSTVASQGLSDTEKGNARTNINAESLGNKTTEVTSSSTDTQYPTAKAVWDDVYAPMQDEIADEWESGISYSQGDVVIHEKNLYMRNSTAAPITPGWYASNWDLITIGSAKMNKIENSALGYIPYTMSDGNIGKSDILLNDAVSNPNLLDNPWFTVNQRGWSSATTTAVTYTVDRWYATSGVTVTKNSDGTITLSSSATNYFCGCYLASEHTSLLGKTVTASVLVGGTVYSKTFTMPSAWPSTDTWFGTVTIVGGESWAQIGYISSKSSLCFRIRIAAGKSVTITAVKLEIGSVSTLHMDVAPNYQTELAKCQRYFQGNTYGANNLLGTCFATNTTTCCGILAFRLPSINLRANPTVTMDDASNISLYGAGGVKVATAVNSISAGKGITVVSSGLTTNEVYYMRVTASTKIWLSADL